MNTHTHKNVSTKKNKGTEKKQIVLHPEQPFNSFYFENRTEIYDVRSRGSFTAKSL